MTVNELLQQLVELCKDGKAQYVVKRINYDDGHEYADGEFLLMAHDASQEVEIT